MHAILAQPRIQRPRQLSLDFHPDVPLGVLSQLESAGRQYGLSLADMELLGQDTETALGFVAAVIERNVPEYLVTVDWSGMENRLVGRADYN